MISFIIPAFNEAFEIGPCLASIQSAAQEVGCEFEVIVVNDASTDATSALARERGARVIDVQLRKISAVRNAGAKAAKGDTYFFVDADTRINSPVVRAALAALDRGAIGGGAWVEFDEKVSWWIDAGLIFFGILYSKICGWAAGCFLYSRRDAFEAVGGFDESLYATEEIVLSRALKTQGRFVILRESVKTSARKIRMYSVWGMIPLTLGFGRHGFSYFKKRQGLEWWYEGKRENSK